MARRRKELITEVVMWASSATPEAIRTLISVLEGMLPSNVAGNRLVHRQYKKRVIIEKANGEERASAN